MNRCGPHDIRFASPVASDASAHCYGLIFVIAGLCVLAYFLSRLQSLQELIVLESILEVSPPDQVHYL